MRILELRQQTNVNPEAMEYPFAFLRDGGYAKECRPIPGQPTEDIGAFPDNIALYHWVHEGLNDYEPWLCLCRLDSGIYVFYRGECDYTGFDCQGDMQIFASRDPNILIQYAMTDEDYEKYTEDTVAAVAVATAVAATTP